MSCPAELASLNEAIVRAARSRAPEWLALKVRYRSWELSAAAEHAVRVLESEQPAMAPRVHRALLDRSPLTSAMGGNVETMVRLLLVCAAAGDWRALCPSAGRLGLSDVAVAETLSQLLAYAEEFLAGKDPFDLIGEVRR